MCFLEATTRVAGNLRKPNETFSNKPNKSNKDLVTSQDGVGGAEWTLLLKERERSLQNLDGTLKDSNLDVAQLWIDPL